MRTAAAASLLLFAASVACAQDAQWMRDYERAQRARPETIGAVGRIAPASEPGEPLVVHGKVFAADGTTPLPGVVVFAYQTDRTGVYNAPGESGWRLRGWAKSDKDGRFEFRSIRPASYPGSRNPQHIHLTMEGPGVPRQWAAELNFSDDPYIGDRQKRASEANGIFGSVREPSVRDGVTHVQHNLRAGPSSNRF